RMSGREMGGMRRALGFKRSWSCNWRQSRRLGTTWRYSRRLCRNHMKPAASASAAKRGAANPIISPAGATLGDPLEIAGGEVPHRRGDEVAGRGFGRTGPGLSAYGAGGAGRTALSRLRHDLDADAAALGLGFRAHHHLLARFGGQLGKGIIGPEVLFSQPREAGLAPPGLERGADRDGAGRLELFRLHQLRAFARRSGIEIAHRAAGLGGFGSP